VSINHAESIGQLRDIIHAFFLEPQPEREPVPA
jgi:hypothetical protein